MFCSPKCFCKLVDRITLIGDVGRSKLRGMVWVALLSANTPFCDVRD